MTTDSATHTRRALVRAAAAMLAVIPAVSVVRGRQSSPAAVQHPMGGAPSACAAATLTCAIAATPAFSTDGTLWLAWAGGGQVSVAKSTDLGRSFSTPTRVTPRPLTLDSGADERPQIVVDRQGRIAMAYAIFKDAKFNGQIFTSMSKDDGATFSTPRSITDDGSSQRFINLAPDQDGRIFASWIDKRHIVAAQKMGKTFDGASLAFAWSTDGGATFEPARIAHDNMCECCRLGVALVGPHRPAVLFRNIFGGERDHAVLTFNTDVTPGMLTRVAEDHWTLDACPHHGPSLAIGPDSAYHAVWFSGGGVRQGSFYAHSLDGGKTFSAPMRIGAAGRQPTRPYVYVLNGSVWLAWKEFDGEQTTVLVARSTDGGTTWSAPRVIATTTESSDHPLLVSNGRQVYLSWMARNEGYRLLPVEPQS